LKGHGFSRAAKAAKNKGFYGLRKNSMEREIFVNARAAGAEAPTILMDLCGPAKAVPLLQGPPHGVFPQPL
jgi:hypothetical protein